MLCETVHRVNILPQMVVLATSNMVSEHKQSKAHKNVMLAYCTRKNVEGWIDHELLKQMDEERIYWRHVLQRVVAVDIY
jgi:radical SAM superfamily enzyme with C-terminal helix-hairpin-helix motif